MPILEPGPDPTKKKRHRKPPVVDVRAEQAPVPDEIAWAALSDRGAWILYHVADRKSVV